MDIRKLKTILELFENSNLTEIEFCEGEERIRLTRQTTTAPASALVLPQNQSAAAAAPLPDSDAVSESVESGTPVDSPMVGTFYSSPSPDKPPFVSVGDKVAAGDVLCIVEAMKLMNEIPSPVSGVVRKILLENGEPVGFGTTLFIIE